MRERRNGFLRTDVTARLFLGSLQIQAWRDNTWVIAWNGRSLWADVGYNIGYGVTVNVQGALHLPGHS